jgi:hypothetical protein
MQESTPKNAKTAIVVSFCVVGVINRVGMKRDETKRQFRQPKKPVIVAKETKRDETKRQFRRPRKPVIVAKETPKHKSTNSNGSYGSKSRRNVARPDQKARE